MTPPALILPAWTRSLTEMVTVTMQRCCLRERLGVNNGASHSLKHWENRSPLTARRFGGSPAESEPFPANAPIQKQNPK